MSRYSVPVYQVRLFREKGHPTATRRVDGEKDAVDVADERARDVDREHLILMLCDTKNRIIGINTVSIGSLHDTIVAPREVLKPAILGNADAVILAHNHPSGDPTPSNDDVRITKDLERCFQMFDIRVLDHVILGFETFVSFRQRGLLGADLARSRVI